MSLWTRIRRMGVAVAVVLVASACSSTTTSDQESILDTVLRTKTLDGGMIVNVPPYGFYDDNNQLQGYDLEILRLLAKDLGAELNTTVLPDAPARVASLQAGDQQIVAADFTVTPERAQSVSFTIPYSTETTVLVGYKEDSDIQSYRDLAGVAVGIVTGTTQEILTQLAPDANFTRFQDDAALNQALASGQVRAQAADAGVAAEIVSRNPDLEIKGDIALGFISLGVPRDDLIWLNWVNQALLVHIGSGDIPALYQEWFGQPFPDTLR